MKILECDVVSWLFPLRNGYYGGWADGRKVLGAHTPAAPHTSDKL